MSTLNLRSRIALTLRAASPVAAGSALLALSFAAAAQQAPAASGGLEDVVVTGIRKSIEDAISIKRDQDVIVEAISAEDIGKLPDTTIAESLARLPGVTTQRDRYGNATAISIRGLGPDFNGYLLNGREQTSTDNSRSLDLSIYPAELIAGATVYKTSDAGLMTAGLAGTIDNKLIKPLDYKGFIADAKAEQTKNGVGLPTQGKGKRYTLSIIDQFADHTVGVAVGFVHSDSNSSQLSSGSWGGTLPVVGGGSVQNSWFGGINYETDLTTDKRDSAIAILEFKPNANFTSEVDAFYAKRKMGTNKNSIQRGTGYGGDSLTAGSTADSGSIISNCANCGGGGWDMIIKDENLFDNDTVKSVGWRNELKLSDTWTAMLDLNTNTATRVEKDIEVYGGLPTAGVLSYTNGTSGTPQLSYSDSLADPNAVKIHDVTGWSGIGGVPQDGYIKGPTITDKLNSVRLDFAHKLDGSMFSQVRFGLNYSDRSKERITDEGLLVPSSGIGSDQIAFPGGSFVLKNVGGTGLDILGYAPQDSLFPGITIQRKYNDDILSKTWTISEKVTTSYVKWDIDTRWGDMPVRGNVGAQMVHTDQSSGGYRADVSSSVTLTNPAGTLTTDGTRYNDFLPSLNLAGDLGDGKMLRFGLSKQLARPTLTDLRNSLAAALATTGPYAVAGPGGTPIVVGSAGNPQLKPFKATAVDLSLEKYFQTKAYVSAAVFYKKLDSYITQSTNLAYDFSTIAAQLGNTGWPATPGVFTSTVNGSGGGIKGVELSASLPFSMFASWLDGFGLMTNFSSTTSSVNLPNLIGLNPSQQVPATGSMPLPGLSHINKKAIVYFEKGGFSAFIADNERSEYVGSVSNSVVGGYPALVYIAPQKWVSAQVGYELQSGPAKGLGIRFEGNNMNKPVYRELTPNGDGSFSPHDTRTGATYALKVFYKFAE
jgi:iron complex outermembrane recepter protein